MITDANEEGSAVNVQVRTRTGQVGKNVELLRGSWRNSSTRGMRLSANRAMRRMKIPQEIAYTGRARIKNSNLMAFDVRAYESVVEGAPGKSYSYLRNTMKKFIEKMITEKEKSVKGLTKFLNRKQGAPAPKKEPKVPRVPGPKANPKSQGAPTAITKEEAGRQEQEWERIQ